MKRRTGAVIALLLVALGAGAAFGRGGGGCFLPDTPILRADGTEAAIRDVKPGDALLAFTPAGEMVNAAVNAVFSLDVDEYVRVATDTIALRVTAEHPFYVGGGTFKTAGELKVGDAIFAYDGRGLSPQPIRTIERVRARTRVYNLQTGSPHTFFAAGVAVHNKGGGCFPAGTQIQTPRGSAAIETLRTGDVVLSVDSQRRPVDSQVEAVYPAHAPIWIVRTTTGELRTTAEHPLMMSDGAFRPAGELKPGDEVCVFASKRVTCASIVECRSTGEECPVFNLCVGSPHTFVADGFVVHNKGGGGGGFGGGHGGSGGGSMSEGQAFVFFCVVIGLVVLVSVVNHYQQRKENLDFNYSRAAIERKADKTRKLLEFIARNDPKFAPDELVKVARSTFVLLQECWQNRDYDPMKPLLMPDLYAEHLAQIGGMVRNHEINIIEHLNVEAVDLVNVRYPNDAHAREFTALITAQARDYYVDTRTHEFLRGDSEPARFQEFWTFHLVNGAWLLREIEQTKESDALKTDNFFEPFTEQGVKQVYAETAGEAGPVGPAVEAGEELKVTRVERLLNYLVQDDKLWDRAAMMERARKVFIEVTLSREAGDPEGIPAADLFPELAAHLQQEIRQRQGEGLSVEFRNLCVRKVELVLARNFSDKAKDEFTARITAHAQQIVRRGGAVASQQPYVTPFEQYWTFGRLDGQWKLKEVEPPARGRELVSAENVDEGVSPAQLEWYYQHPRAA